MAGIAILVLIGLVIIIFLLITEKKSEIQELSSHENSASRSGISAKRDPRQSGYLEKKKGSPSSSLPDGAPKTDTEGELSQVMHSVPKESTGKIWKVEENRQKYEVS